MQEQLLQIVSSLQRIAVDAIPRVIVGLLVTVALVLVAGLIERVLRMALVRIRFDSILEQAGIDKLLLRVGIRQSLNQVLPRLVYFLLLLLFARAAADAFGLIAISEGIAAMFAYLPNVVAAVLLVVVGVSVSQFAGRTVTQAAQESGIEFAKPLGSVVSALILFVVGVMAIGQLRFDTDMVRIVTVCTLAGLALAFGLSVGLGTRDITRNVLAGFYARKVFRAGDTLEIRGQRGVLREITATQTLIEQETGLMAVANTVFLDETIRQDGEGSA
jgi:small-conductance mechanosensitive channel